MPDTDGNPVEAKLVDKIRILSNTRQLILEALSRFTDYVNNFSDPNKIYHLQARLEKVQLLWAEFSGVQSDLELFDNKVDHKKYRSIFEDEFFDSTGSAKSILDRNFCQLAQQNAPAPPPSIPTIVNSSPNLPKIKLPEFFGSYDQWLQFADTYKSLIHNSSHLSKIEKFWYLKSCLKGEAANILTSLEVSETNYDKAWTLLCERYENKRSIIHTHLKAIFEMKNVSQESHVLLRNLVDSFLQHLRALESLGLPVQHWDAIIIYHLTTKLDHTTRRDWEDFSLKLPGDTPNLNDFTSFLNRKCQVLENINSVHSGPPRSSFKPQFSSNSRSSKSGTFINVESACILCKDNHFIWSCPKFIQLSPQERLNNIRKLNGCTNCLRLGHNVKECRNTLSCKKCSLRHNTLLHLTKSTNTNRDTNNIDSKTDNLENATTSGHSQALSIMNNPTKEPYILLSTANVLVFDNDGIAHNCRALLDNCSQSNFITKEFFTKLNLTSKNISHSVEGFGSSLTKIFKTTFVKIKSHFNSFTCDEIPFLITENITKNLPDFSFSAKDLQIPKNINLADKTFNKPGSIDMLIGASIFWNLVCVGQIVLPNKHTILQKTKLGWILSGPLPLYNQNASVCNLNIDTAEITKQLEKSWQIEEYQNKSINSLEENECEEHFQNSTIRDSSGKFVVSLPLKENVSQLGSSFDTALKRFFATEKKLSKNSQLKSQYISFMSEYENLGHMTKLENKTDCSFNSDSNETSNIPEFFLPHHGVLKESSSTTKLRVVFDGSAKTSSGLSLNDVLKIGPKIQDDLVDIVIRFRTYTYAFTADIEKMYRCVLVQDNQRTLQKILWRSDPSQELHQYKLNTVTYGTSSASFLAIRSLQQVAFDNKNQYPKASEVILSSFYVDDCLSGSNEINEGQGLISDLNHILQSVGFNLRKWATNNHELLEGISVSQQFSNQKIISDDQTTKTLGLTWNSAEDVFQYSVQFNDYASVTKRTVLAITAQIFDPLGLIGPCIILAKIMLQSLWQLNLDWDESVPLDFHNQWQRFCQQLPSINDIKISRHILCNNPVLVELHGFSDSSMKAYGACCYLRSIDSNGKIHVSLVSAKSRVAPIKTITLPRLELSAAVLLVRLTQRIMTSIKINIDNIYYWTDSSIVLSWLSMQPGQLNTFVANRISEIQQSSQMHQWHHVSSQNNAADIISRGLDPNRLKDCHIWWFGPPFLFLKKELWPQEVVKISDLPEIKTSKLTLFAQTRNDISFINKYSSFAKLKRITAYCLRFLSNSSNKTSKSRSLGPLTTAELNKAIGCLSKAIQDHYFHSEIRALKKSMCLPPNSKILRLNPFLDRDGLLRVGGRLKYSNFSFDRKHPILLPSDSHFTRLIVDHEHLRHLHAGPQTTLAAVRMNFWIIDGRNTIQKILRKCVKCFRVNPVASCCQMGDLPKARVVAQRPFYVTGVDYAGPFMVKDGKAKNRTLVKCYLCIFICFSTKAVHLELATDLSSESFLNCLKRFVSRRGICAELYSDNGTNFIGANADLKETLNKIKRDSSFSEFLSINNMTWHFSPPHGPNFGGLWEAAVKSAKFHLKRIVGMAHLTYESLSTVFIQIEAVLNSRPLTPLSNDPNDFSALTPAHFLIGESLKSLPQFDVQGVPENRLTHYLRLQQQLQHFWRRWSDHYLCMLQERSKWCKQFPNVKKDILVVIKDDNSAPLCWKLGRIVEVFPGSDGVVRVVNIKTNSGIFKRPVSRICILPIET